MSATITTTARENVPLCVDLDGTLIKTDMLWESFVRLLRRSSLACGHAVLVDTSGPF